MYPGWASTKSQMNRLMKFSFYNRLLVTLTCCFMSACSNQLDTALFSLVPHPQVPGQRAYAIEQVAIINNKDGIMLAGELTFPADGKAKAGLVLVSGHQDGVAPALRDNAITGHKYFLVLSDLLTRRGYAVLRYDNRGVGASTGSYVNATDIDFASDAAAALQWLQGESGLALGKYGFIGHSQGAIKSLLASHGARPDFIVSLAGLAVETMAGTALRQTQRIYQAKGEDPETIKQIQEGYRAIFDIIGNASSPAEARVGLRSYARANGKTDEGYIEGFAQHFGTRWWFEEAHRDPKPVITGYTNPVLALFASQDLLVCSDYNAPRIRPLLRHPLSMVQIYQGLNHLFQTAVKGTGPSEYWEIETTIEEFVVDDVDQWIQSLPEPADNAAVAD